MINLLHETYFALFTIISLGILVGKISIKGVSLQSSAVLFVAMIFGHFGIQLPEALQQIGLILFIFTVGIQAGPGFFDSLKQGDLFKYTAPVFVVLISGVVLSFIYHYVLDIDGPMQVGLFTGSFSSTSSLAAALEATKNEYTSTGYAISYPFGILGSVLFIRLLPKFMKIDLQEDISRIEKEEELKSPPVTGANFIVSNENVFDKSISDLELYDMTKCNVSRIKKEVESMIVDSKTILNKGDIVHAIGTETDLKKFEFVIGPQTDKSFSMAKTASATSKRIVVTNKKIIGKRISQVPQITRLRTVVTRIRRSGIDITPSRATRFRYGDKVTVVFPKTYTSEVFSILGGSENRNIDFFPIALSIVLGILIGQISIPITETLRLAPGYTGGILLTTLLLGRLDKTGPLLWSIAGNTNQLLRQVGLLFFLSAVGTKSGSTIVAGIQHYGVKYFFYGIALTIIPMIAGTLFSKYVLKLNTLQLFGVLSAAMTSGPALIASNEITDSNIPDRVYSVAFPVALIFTIMIAQLLALTL